MTTNKNQQLIDRLATEARRGKVSRREFLSQSAVAGISASAATGLWASSAQAAPKRGGTFRWGIHDGNTSDTHDPGTYVTRQMIFLAHQYRSYLTLINPDNSLGGDLATEWSATPDAKVWTFKLTKKAQFHSGKKFTSNDVVASLNHHRDHGSYKTTSAAKALLTTVKDITAPDDYTVVITMEGGNADLPWLMTDYHLAICPANPDGSIDWKSGDGTGPYKIDSGQFGVSWKLSRWDHWHLEGAYFDKVNMIVLNDPNARQTALVTGDVDCITNVERKTLALLKRRKGIIVDNIPSGAAITMPMFCDTPPFNDVNMRTALKLAINREEIIKKIAFGAATIGNDFHLAPVQPYCPTDIPQRHYDPEKARSLAKKAGYSGEPIKIHVADSVFSGAVDMCVLYSAQAKKAGINVQVVREPSDGFYSDVWLKKPFCAVSWGARPTPDVMFTLAYSDGAAWNESHWHNKQFNKLLLEAKAELDQAKRKVMYREMCLLMRNDGGTILPFFNNFVYARSSKVHHGPHVAASWACDGARAPSRWWFA